MDNACPALNTTLVNSMNLFLIFVHLYSISESRQNNRNTYHSKVYPLFEQKHETLIIKDLLYQTALIFKGFSSYF